MAAYTRETCLSWLAGAGLSPGEAKYLLTLEPDPVRLYAAWTEGGKLFGGIPLPERTLAGLKRSGTGEAMRRYGQLIGQHGIRAVTFQDPGYPEKLADLPDAPPVLFFLGELRAAEGRSVSMVGSRNASLKGTEAAGKIAEQLSRNGVRIVSGLAFGIDAAAHRGCLRGESPTTAVLGCGLDQTYPAGNAALKREILEKGGLILSEFAPGEKPLGWHFPYRNRIISGLGDCLALIEARIRSGSMTTVQHALDQGKDVFVYPGEPGSPKTEGNHLLLREGAIYFTTADDLLEDMRWLDKKQDSGQNNPCAAEREDPSLSAAERLVLSRLGLGDQSFDQLCGALNMTAAELNASLSMLQIRGMVQALPGKIYALNQPD